MHAVVERIAKGVAVLGALVLGFLIVMTCVSILGRELNSFLNSDVIQAGMKGIADVLLGLGIGPITGDFELIENGMAFAIFAFMPLAQIHAAHVTVDIFTSRFPPIVIRWMVAVTEAVFAAVLIVFAVKLYEGMLGKQRYNETTYLLQFEVWRAYALAFAGSVVAALTGVWMAGVRLYEAVTGAAIVSEDGAEAGH